MKEPGRPSHRDDDLNAIVAMADMWSAGHGEYSVRALSFFIVGLPLPRPFPKETKTLTPHSIAGRGSLESKAKRLERLFNGFNKQGLMMPVSVYRTRDMARYFELQRLGEIAVGPFNKHRLTNPIFVKADRAAVTATAKACGISSSDVEELSAKGLETLQNWLPSDYPATRI